MKYSLLLLTVAIIDFALNVNGLPVPVGQIIKYRVPSKYFNQDGTSTTLATAAEGSNSLYDFLLHKHFGAGGDDGEDKRVVTNVAMTETEAAATTPSAETSAKTEEVEEVKEAEEASTMKNMHDRFEVIWTCFFLLSSLSLSLCPICWSRFPYVFLSTTTSSHRPKKRSTAARRKVIRQQHQRTTTSRFLNWLKKL